MKLGHLTRGFALMALLVGTGMSSGCGIDSRLAEAPIAVVLSEDSEGTRLTAVDLTQMEVVSTHELRSRSYSLDGMQRDRVVISAQSGGVGPDADDVAGVWDLPSDELRYVKLPYPNPSAVAVGGSVGYVMHGFQTGDSLVLSAVDLADGDRVTTGTASEWAHDPESVDGEVYLPVSASPLEAASPYSASGGSIERLGPSLEQSRLADIPRFAMRLVADPVDEDGLIVAGTVDKPRSGYAGDWRLTRIEESSGRVVQERSLSIGYGVAALCAIGDDLAIADSNCLDLDDPGREVVIVDGVTLAERRRLKVEGAPAALAQWKHRLLVYDGIDNELVELDADSGRPSRRLKLEGHGMGSGDIVVFDTQARGWE